MSIVKSFSVGNGDMFYINHNVDSFTTIDCCYEDEEKRDKNFEEIHKLALEKGITRFISTHPDNDHIKGIENFCDIVGVSNFYCVQNKAIKEDKTESFKKYCELRDSDKAYAIQKDCHRKWLNESDEIRCGAGINFYWPDVEDEDFKEALNNANAGKEYNNICPIFTYSVKNSAKMIWMGDLETDFQEKIMDKVNWPEVDVLFAPHHGRKSGAVPKEVLNKLNPYLIVIGEAPSEDLYYYPNYNTITQNSTGDIVFKCVDDYIHLYIENSSYKYDTSFLENKHEEDSKYGHYLGSFKTKS